MRMSNYGLFKKGMVGGAAALFIIAAFVPSVNAVFSDLYDLYTIVMNRLRLLHHHLQIQI